MTLSIALAVGVGLVGILDGWRRPTTPSNVRPTAVERHDARPPRVTPAIEAKRTVDLLCGPQPASLGPVFASVELGRVVGRLPDVAAPSGLDVKISLLTTGRRVDGVDITVPYDRGWAGCYQFAEQLHHRWGQPSEAHGNIEIWNDVAHHRAATFTENFSDCALRFSRRVSPEQWLNKTRSSLVPIWAIGHPVAELEEALALPPSDDPNVLRWRDESLGDPFEEVQLTANVRRGRVVGIIVVPPFGDPVADVLWERVKALYGAPDRVDSHEELIGVRWRRGPGIRAGKYSGQDAYASQMILEPGPHGVKLVGPTPPPATADDGVLISITFGN